VAQQLIPSRTEYPVAHDGIESLATIAAKLETEDPLAHWDRS
jgi:hypothetical protein